MLPSNSFAREWRIVCFYKFFSFLFDGLPSFQMRSIIGWDKLRYTTNTTLLDLDQPRAMIFDVAAIILPYFTNFIFMCINRFFLSIFMRKTTNFDESTTKWKWTLDNKSLNKKEILREIWKWTVFRPKLGKIETAKYELIELWLFSHFWCDKFHRMKSYMSSLLLYFRNKSSLRPVDWAKSERHIDSW